MKYRVEKEMLLGLHQQIGAETAKCEGCKDERCGVLLWEPMVLEATILLRRTSRADFETPCYPSQALSIHFDLKNKKGAKETSTVYKGWSATSLA
jgi:hypothetical protein